jgi:hypothetical protein
MTVIRIQLLLGTQDSKTFRKNRGRNQVLTENDSVVMLESTPDSQALPAQFEHAAGEV